MPKLTTASHIAKLRRQIKRLEERENSIAARKKKIALTKIVALAKSSGLSVSEIHTVLGARPSKRGSKKSIKRVPGRSKLLGRKVSPKYRNPANKQDTWTGRGRAPKWAAGLQAAGKLESALIEMRKAL